MVDSGGNLDTSYTYDPYGNTSVTGTSNTNEFQYTGRENEGNGLYFYRARYYSPLLGRFITEDPLGFVGSGTNFYAYAFNNPVSHRDPSGLDGRDESGFMPLPYALLQASNSDSHKSSRGDTFSWWSTFGHSFFHDLQVPDVCGRGGFVYGGGETEIPLGPVTLEGEAVGVVGYDSEEGGAHGGVLAGGITGTNTPLDNISGGIESSRTWSDWQEHTEPIGFYNFSEPGPGPIGPLNVEHMQYGPLLQYSNGNITIGGYFGGAGENLAGGRGGYIVLGFNCK